MQVDVCDWVAASAITHLLSPANTSNATAAIDQSTISRRVGAPCFGDPKQQQQDDSTTPYLGRSGAWVRWDGGKGELEVGWRPAASIYEVGGQESGAWVWRTAVGFAGEGVRVGGSRLEAL